MKPTMPWVPKKGNLFFKGYSLGRMPVFIKHGEFNQYILNVHFFDGPSQHTNCV
jgi:hypothetical protein